MSKQIRSMLWDFFGRILKRKRLDKIKDELDYKLGDRLWAHLQIGISSIENSVKSALEENWD